MLAGCEPCSHVAGATLGAVVVHGFTGTPASVRGVGHALAGAGLDVEVPRLPGHGTDIGDMIATTWTDWLDEVTRARAVLAERCELAVLVGQSMGGTLVLASALDDPGGVAGIVCVNPLVRRRSADDLELIDDLLDDGIEIVPGEGSDIADPEATDVSYDGTPLRPLRSLLLDGLVAIDQRYGELLVPLRLFTSRQDHVVPPTDSEYLAAAYGGPVAHTWLERSFHVATRDHDRGLVEAGTVAFAAGLAS